VKRARILQSARVTIPESGRDAIRVITDLPWEVAGQRAPSTGIYLEPTAPEFAAGTLIEWGSHAAIVDGVAYRRIEQEFSPDAPLA
jgi:hypothetical protein